MVGDLPCEQTQVLVLWRYNHFLLVMICSLLCNELYFVFLRMLYLLSLSHGSVPVFFATEMCSNSYISIQLALFFL